MPNSVNITIGVNNDRADVSLDDLRRKLEALGRVNVTARVRIDTSGFAKAKTEIDALSRTVDARVRESVSTHRSVFSRLFGGGGSGGSGGLGGLLGGAGGAAGGGGLLSSLGGSPYGIAGIAGGIQGALALIPSLVGLGLGSGVGGLGALLAKSLDPKAFAKTLASMKQSLKSALTSAPGLTQQGNRFGAPVGPSFIQGLQSIMRQFAGFMKQIGPGLGDMFRASLPFLKAWVGLLEQAAKVFLPALTQVMNQMVQSGALKTMMNGLLPVIKAVATLITEMGPNFKVSAEIFAVVMKVIAKVIIGLGIAFDQAIGFWKMFAGVITGNWKAVVNAFDAMRHQIATVLDNLGLAKFGHEVANVFDGMRHETAVIWDKMWGQFPGPVIHFIEHFHTDVANWRHDIANTFDSIRHDIASVWDAVWSNTIGRMVRGVNDVHKWDANMRHDIASDYDSIRHDIASAWDIIWNNTVGRVRRGIDDVVSFFRGLPGKVLAALRGFGHSLAAFAVAAFTEMWNGIKHVAADIWHWLTGWVHALPGWLRSLLGIHSPSSVFYDIGWNMMKGLEKGIQHAAVHAADAARHEAAHIADNIRNLLGFGGGGFPAGGSIQSLMKSMAARVGWTGQQWQALYDVEEREAGFNPNARNPTSGAYGLAQFINGPSEYYQYGGNPNTVVGQIIAMFNYIKQRYGNPLNAWAHELNYGYYDQGGWLPTGASLAINKTGRPERILGPNEAQSVVLEIVGGDSEFEKFMAQFLRKFVRIKGGGSVQRAFGRN